MPTTEERFGYSLRYSAVRRLRGVATPLRPQEALVSPLAADANNHEAPIVGGEPNLQSNEVISLTRGGIGDGVVAVDGVPACLLSYTFEGFILREYTAI